MVVRSRWEVEWSSDLPVARDTNQSTYVFRDFSTNDEAVSIAREVYPKDVFGSVRITELKLSRGGLRVYLGDSEGYVGGD
jgi:hypothetical protein